MNLFSKIISFFFENIFRPFMTHKPIILKTFNHDEFDFRKMISAETEYPNIQMMNLIQYRENVYRKNFCNLWTDIIGTNSKTCLYENNDCSVFCIATAFMIPYDSAHQYLKSNGRIYQSSCKNWEQEIIHRLVEKNLISEIPWHEFKKYNVSKKKWSTIRVHTFLKKFPRGTFILTLSEHVLTVRDGYLIDRIDSSKCIVLQAHKVMV